MILQTHLKVTFCKPGPAQLAEKNQESVGICQQNDSFLFPANFESHSKPTFIVNDGGAVYDGSGNEPHHDMARVAKRGPPSPEKHCELQHGKSLLFKEENSIL